MPRAGSRIASDGGGSVAARLFPVRINVDTSLFAGNEAQFAKRIPRHEREVNLQ
jgi:hypothetical protein